MIKIHIDNYELELSGDNLKILEGKYERWMTSLNRNPQFYLIQLIDSELIPTVTFESFCVGYLMAILESENFKNQEEN